MSLPEPLFGEKPVDCRPEVVQSVCVAHYPTSSTRPFIWEGFQTAHGKALCAGAPGRFWVSGDFVVDHTDPDHAQVHLRIPLHATRDDKLADLLVWLNDEAQTERLSCDLSALVEPPPDDPARHLIEEYAEILFDSFTAHGDSGKKGFPIIPLP